MGFQPGEVLEAFLERRWEEVTYVKPLAKMHFCLTNLTLAPAHRVRWHRSAFVFPIGEDDLRKIQFSDDDLPPLGDRFYDENL